MVVHNSVCRTWNTLLLMPVSVFSVFHATTFNARAQAPSTKGTVGKETLVQLSGNVPTEQIARAQPLGRMAATDQIDFAVVLPLRNEAELRGLIDRLYDPASPDYGRYLSSTEFRDRFGPTLADYEAVIKYARSHGLTITVTHPNRLVVDVTGPTRAVETAFGVHLNRYRSVRDGRVFRAPDREPSLPASLANRIQGVIGLDSAGVWRTHSQKSRPALGLLDPRFDLAPQTTGSGSGGGLPSGGGSGPLGGFTPSDIRAAYDVPTTPLNGSGQMLAVFTLSGYTPSDITYYETYFGLNQVPLQNVLIDHFNGATGNGSYETTLDIQMQVALAPGASKILVYEGPNSSSGVIDTYNRIATDNLAKSISSSWGLSELSASASTRNSENSIFMQMAAQGQSIFIASGDNGAYNNGSTLSVQDPASQPYVTGVGGTTLTTNGAGGGWQSETTWNDSYGAGGGGISQVWSIPSYQSAAGIITTPSLGSTTMRNVPDVSLNSEAYATYCTSDPSQKGGPWYWGYGTSYAAPLWAGLTALVNQQRAIVGKSTLGFANPMLYTAGTGTNYHALFHDIADNSTNGYYPAVTGYDLATGWGTYNAMNLLSNLAGIAQPRANFYQDGYEDLVFQNSVTGQIALWDMNGLTVNGGGPLSYVPSAGYQVVGCGDFNGDGLPDLVFQNQTSGQIAFAFLNHTQVIGGGPITPIPSPGYHVVGVGDFNGDGQPDLLFQSNSTGQLEVWYISGGAQAGGGAISQVPSAGYQVVGVADFNGDGHPDILFQNSSTGQLAVWYVSGLNVIGGGFITNIPSAGWQVRAVDDLNHDGNPDIVFQNTSTGAVAIWFMNGLTLTSGGNTSSNPSPNYWIAGAR